MRALEGLSEDPRLKRLLDAGPGEDGRGVHGHGKAPKRRVRPPWTRLKDELRAAPRLGSREVRVRRDESKGVRGQVNDLQRELAEGGRGSSDGCARELGKSAGGSGTPSAP